MASDNSRLEEEVAGSMGSMNATSVVFDGKKIRKPYTITKSRESWTDEEHDRFITALRLFDRDWKSIEEFVGTKSAIQIRSHAQKYFLKVQKYGTGEHVPPPRPKRKSVNPYPRKASNIALGSATAIQTAPLASQSATAFQVSSYLLEPEYIFGSDSSIALSHNSACPHGMHMQKENIMPRVGMMVDNCYGSSESPTSLWPICKTNVQRSHVLSVPENIMPPVGMMVDHCYGSSESPTSSWPICKTDVQRSHALSVPENIMPPVGMMVDNCYDSFESPTSSWPICRTNVQRSHVLSVPENIMPPVGMMVDNCYGSSESPTSSWPICETDIQRNHVLSVPAFSCGFVNEAKPAIAQVYNFIGSIFDPNSSGHLQKLKEMDPAVIGLILSGMRNLSINLTSPGCEDYRKVLASYAASSSEVKLDNANVSFQANESASDSFISKR